MNAVSVEFKRKMEYLDNSELKVVAEVQMATLGFVLQGKDHKFKITVNLIDGQIGYWAGDDVVGTAKTAREAGDAFGLLLWKLQGKA